MVAPEVVSYYRTALPPQIVSGFISLGMQQLRERGPNPYSFPENKRNKINRADTVFKTYHMIQKIARNDFLVDAYLENLYVPPPPDSLSTPVGIFQNCK